MRNYCASSPNKSKHSGLKSRHLFWKKSREALADYVAGKQVKVIEIDVDRYKRIVGQVYLGDLWVNGALVRGGYAYVYPRYATAERLYEFEEEVRESQAWIWSCQRKKE